MDYLVIMRMGDTKDPELQRRRAELRPAHLERASSFRRHTRLFGRARKSERGDDNGAYDHHIHRSTVCRHAHYVPMPSHDRKPHRQRSELTEVRDKENSWGGGRIDQMT